MTRLYHLVVRSEWEALAPGDLYEPVSLRKEGYIHLSTDRQLLATAARHFAEATDLMVLAIRKDEVASILSFEEAHGELYPHLYGPLQRAAIIEVVALPRLTDGSFDVPAEWKAWEDYFR